MGIETLIDSMSRNEQIAALQLIGDRVATSGHPKGRREDRGCCALA